MLPNLLPPHCFWLQFASVLSAIVIAINLSLICLPCSTVSAVEIGEAFNAFPKSLYKLSDGVEELTNWTFHRKVFSTHRATLVKFYLSWCGHCRAFAPTYIGFAKEAQYWNRIISINAVNCALEETRDICQENNVQFVPMLKFYPRSAKVASDGAEMLTEHRTIESLRDTTAGLLLAEYEDKRYGDWPQFSYLDETISSERQLWLAPFVPLKVNFVLLVFEVPENSSAGAQVLLDFSSQAWIYARRATNRHPLAVKIGIRKFPAFAVLQRGAESPTLISELKQSYLHEIARFSPNGTSVEEIGTFLTTLAPPGITPPPIEILRTKYYTSETDLLLATRYTLANEIPFHGGAFVGQNRTDLYNFVSLLVKYYPQSARTRLNLRRLGYQAPTPLERSSRVRSLMRDLYHWLMLKQNDTISSDEFKEKFAQLEIKYERPFPTSSNVQWDHCKGTNLEFRGYTCGLWMLFHSLTVHAYLEDGLDGRFDPLPTLFAIRGYVQSFFGCRHCAQHFLHMADFTLNMSQLADFPSDVVMWLWNAHNSANARLAGDVTEDPAFPKRQFPAPFLCPLCHSNVGWNRREAFKYMLGYYTDVRPHPELQSLFEMNNGIQKHEVDRNDSVPGLPMFAYPDNSAAISAALGGW